MHQGSSHDLHLPVSKFLPQADAGARLLSWKKEDWLDANDCPKINEITDHRLRKLVNKCCRLSYYIVGVTYSNLMFASKSEAMLYQY
jgi:hypothetical protein